MLPSFGTDYNPGDTNTDVNEAVGQALGVTMKELAKNDELEWTKAGVGCLVEYGKLGIYSNEFEKAADVLNDALSPYGSFNFTVEYVYDGNIFRPRRFAVCVDKSNKTAVVFGGGRENTSDWWGIVIIVGKETEVVFRMFWEKCDPVSYGAGIIAGPVVSPCISYVYRYKKASSDIHSALWAFFDPVKLEWHFGAAAAFADPDTPREYVLRTDGW
jgi:hypothetical protein